MNCKITHTAFLKFVNTCPSASPASAEVAESKLEKCARGLNSPEWYKVIDERFDVLPNNDVFFQVMIGMPPEEGIAIVRGGDVEFYSTKTMHGKEARIVGKRWVNAVAEFELRGKPFHVLFQERPDEPGIHTEILPSDGASGKDDPWPKTSIKGRPLTEKEKAQFRGQAERVLKTYVSNLNRLKEIGSIVPKEIPASCPRP